MKMENLLEHVQNQHLKRRKKEEDQQKNPRKQQQRHQKRKNHQRQKQKLKHQKKILVERREIPVVKLDQLYVFCSRKCFLL